MTRCSDTPAGICPLAQLAQADGLSEASPKRSTDAPHHIVDITRDSRRWSPVRRDRSMDRARRLMRGIRHLATSCGPRC
jgi:hypothetical protein